MKPADFLRTAAAGLAVWLLSGPIASANPLAGHTAEQYLGVIEATRPATPPPAGVTGITVPHHLVADDLMARGFWAASAGRYKRIILLAPDHFRALDGPFGIHDAAMPTVFGAIPAATGAIARLAAHSDLFEPLSETEVAAEHGLGAVTPFIRHFWPGAHIVPVLASIDSQPGDWARAAEALAPLIDETTLFIQSTDFSHYLPVGQAVLRDQETLSQIAAGSGTGIARLHQPGHLDSKAAQAIQMAIQTGLGARPVVIANRNQVEYGGRAQSTTSYVVTIWHPDPAAGARLRYSDQAVLYFAGDLLLGRYLTPVLSSETAVEEIAGIVEGIVDAAPLVVNFEGVLLDEAPVGAPPAAHIMQDDLAGPVLVRLGVTAASLANNHAADLGAVGIEESERLLTRRAIPAMRHGTITDLGPVRVLALTLFENNPGTARRPALEDPARLACAARAAPPVVAFVHWGREYTNEASPFERTLAQRLSACGIVATIGHHSHMAATGVEAVSGGSAQMVYSLGNFLFDQSRPEVSGALLEMRVFAQGTVATRLIPIPNLFEQGRAALDASSPAAAR